jgi:hypothetical protein
MTQPCRCELCLALLELAASAERELQSRKVEPKMAVIRGGKRRRAA